MKNSFLDKTFPFLDELRYRIVLVLIIMVYSVFFMVTFDPFTISSMLKLKWLGLVAMGLLGTVPIAISQLVIRPLIRIKTFKVKHFLLWFAAEVIALTILMAIMYDDDSEYSFFKDFQTTFKYTALLAIIIYSFAILIIVLIQVNKEKNTKNKITSKDIDLISFKDERDQVKFSVKRKDILYIESTDNYITVFFSNGGKVSKHMIRTSLKRVEESELSTKLLRCHRSFIVNLENVEWMKKEGRNFVLKIREIESFIPVSRSYIPQFKSLLHS
ncbi:MAG: LytTR family transcriptional regulator [Chlorobi bacterium]|nr:LytTR family transcriptional regulator [Chlorobiota bacterium]